MSRRLGWGSGSSEVVYERVLLAGLALAVFRDNKSDIMIV